MIFLEREIYLFLLFFAVTIGISIFEPEKEQEKIHVILLAAFMFSLAASVIAGIGIFAITHLLKTF